jgi:hypothetical protein
MTGPQRRKALEPGGKLQPVTARPAAVISLADRRAADAARAARRAQRAADRAELAALAGTVREFPAGVAEDLMDPEFSAEVRAILAIRFEPGRCDLAGFDRATCWGRLEAHHLQPKGMGGTSLALGVPSNGLLICAAHHGWIHDRPILAAQLGLLRPKASEYRNADLSLDGGLTRILMDDKGGYRVLPRPLDAA